MKAIEYLKREREIKMHYADVTWGYYDKDIDEAIKELEALQNENKSLVKTLEKYNEEMIELRKANQDLKNSNNELLKGLKSTQKRLEEWLEKCK